MHPLANFNASKSRKLMEIVKELAPPPPPPPAENSSDSDDSLMGPPKKIRKMTTKNKAPCGKKIVKKYIMMRWIHYFFDSKKPYPRNNSNNQSSIKLELIESKEYNVAYIREAGLKFFNDSYTNKIFLESTIELGDWDKKIVKNFVINGHTCGLFQYLKYHKMQPSRTTLYIMTFEKTETTTSQMMKEIQDLPCYPGSSNFNNQSAGSSTSTSSNAISQLSLLPRLKNQNEADEKMPKVNSPNAQRITKESNNKVIAIDSSLPPSSFSPKSNNLVSKAKPAVVNVHQMCKLTKVSSSASSSSSSSSFKTSSSDRSFVQSQRLSTSHMSRLTKVSSSSSKTAGSDRLSAQSPRLSTSQMSRLTKLSSSPSSGKSKSNQSQTSSNYVSINKMPKVISSFTVLYSIPVQFPDNDQEQIVFWSKRDIFKHLIRNKLIHGIEYSSFEPVEWGYPISMIMRDGVEIFKIENENDEDTVFILEPIGLERDHKIVYDCDIIRGSCTDGFGLGVISQCFDCDPVITWYRNGQVYKKNTKLYWVQCPDNENPWMHSWKCEITCVDKPPTKKIYQDHQLNIHKLIPGSKLPSIDPEKVEIFDDVILGKGAQGVVKKAKWDDTTFVAIKSIETSGINSSCLRRELDVLQFMRHPNVIWTLGIYFHNDYFHVMMELIDGESLDKILFTEKIRDEYKLSTQDKNSITNQIAGAVSYMHRQECPIIHADIKPANIIITHQPNLVAKLCDFGLSKLVDVAMTMGATCSDAVGTPIYMAPELLLHAGKNTTSSDVWALGCSIIEIYNEVYTWNAKSKTELAKWFSVKKQPHYGLVPNDILKIVQGFLSYDYTNRGNAKNICIVYGKNGWKL